MINASKKRVKIIITIVCVAIISIAGIFAVSAANSKNSTDAVIVNGAENGDADVLKNKAGPVAADKIIEEGIIGKWHYRKWDSGVAECWGIATMSLSKDAYEWGAGIYCASGYGNLPKEIFSTYDCISIDPIKWYQIGASGRVTAGGTLEGNVFGKGDNMTSLKEGDTIEVNCIVKGKWK